MLHGQQNVKYMEKTEWNSWPRFLKSEVMFVDTKVFDTNFRTCFGDEDIFNEGKLTVLLNFMQYWKLNFLRIDRIKQIRDS